ncbi:MAG TPA: hypothetical protein VF230_06770 [Acidimicrobiales bacterium]
MPRLVDAQLHHAVDVDVGLALGLRLGVAGGGEQERRRGDAADERRRET